MLALRQCLADLVQAELTKKHPFRVIFKKHELLRALPKPEGVGVALRLSYLCMDTTEGHAQFDCRVWSRSSCRNWSCPEVGAPARSAALVPGIDCGADPVGQTCSASSTEHYCVASESQQHSAPLHSTPLTTPQRASRGPRQPTCSAPIGQPTVN